MTKEETLLIPRYRVVADYPGNTELIGYIFSSENNHSYYDRYPAIFQRLNWWEFREESEMPEFVKLINNKESYGLPDGCIRKVTAWEKGVNQQL